MTDRELLKLAAYAAGYWSDEFNCPDKLPHLGWNPLTDDGDAFRLAVKLLISVEHPNPRDLGGGYVVARTWRAYHRKMPENLFVTEEFHGDPYAATRRAIVRAAAEIGKH